LKKIKDKNILVDVKDSIINIETAKNLKEIINLEKIKGDDNYFRIRIKNYRIGLFIDQNTVNIVRCLHRKDMYKFFPPK
jgi:mRNA interferase RelE/StbE